MESALKFGGIDFATGQRHRLENSLMPECRFLVGLLRRAALQYLLLACIPALFSHENELRQPRPQNP